MALSLTAGQSGVGVIPVVQTGLQPLKQHSLPGSQVRLVLPVQAKSITQRPTLSVTLGHDNGGST